MKDLFNEEIKNCPLNKAYVFMQTVNGKIEAAVHTTEPEIWLSQYKTDMISKVAQACLLNQKVHAAFALYESRSTHFELVNYMEFKND
jgi:hypothetical protein